MEALKLEQAILDNKGLVHKFMRQPKYDKVEDREEFEQVCTIGLWKALEKYDESKGVKFGYFAYIYMQGEATRYFRNNHWLSGHKNRTSSEQPIYMDSKINTYTSKHSCNDDSGLSIANCLEDENDYIEEVVEHQYSRELVGDLLDVARLDDREIYIIKSYYSGELSLAKIGDSLGITKSRVYVIMRKAVKKMKDIAEYWGEVAI